MFAVVMHKLGSSSNMNSSLMYSPRPLPLLLPFIFV